MNWMASDAPAAKVRRGEPTGEPDRELLIAIAKLGLRAAEEVKELQASIFRNVIIPAESEYVEAAKNATTAFADKTRGKGGKQLVGCRSGSMRQQG